VEVEGQGIPQCECHVAHAKLLLSFPISLLDRREAKFRERRKRPSIFQGTQSSTPKGRDSPWEFEAEVGSRNAISVKSKGEAPTKLV
jgi:hypothetical protein